MSKHALFKAPEATEKNGGDIFSLHFPIIDSNEDESFT